MKKYIICLLFGLLLLNGCAKKSIEETETSLEITQEEKVASNLEQVQHETETSTEEEIEEYYLVSEDSFLIIFLKDQKTIYLYTHIPIMDFPEEQQERLREGIWFDSMLDVFHYLESYTS